MFGDDMCEDMCVWRRCVSEYVCLATICVRICVFGLDIARDPVGWPTVPPISRCSEANVWSSRFDALESLRHEVEYTGITASCSRTRSNARESLRHAVECTGITAPRCRADCSRLVHICAPKAGWCTEVSQFSAFCEAEVVPRRGLRTSAIPERVIHQG